MNNAKHVVMVMLAVMKYFSGEDSVASSHLFFIIFLGGLGVGMGEGVWREMCVCRMVEVG